MKFELAELALIKRSNTGIRFLRQCLQNLESGSRLLFVPSELLHYRAVTE